MLQEHLFDVSDLQDREPVLISKCGNLEVTFDYDSGNHRMRVTVHQAKEIPTKDRGGSNHNQVQQVHIPFIENTGLNMKMEVWGNKYQYRSSGKCL